MRTILAVLAVATILLSGCTVFTDDVYRLQSGQWGSSAYGAVDHAIHEEFKAKFGEDRVFRADVEKKYNHWTSVSDIRAVGMEKYRVHVTAYPQLDADGHYEPVVIAKREVYTGSSYGMGRGGPTAMYSGKWTETNRERDLEAELANGIHARLRGANAGGE